MWRIRRPCRNRVPRRQTMTHDELPRCVIIRMPTPHQRELFSPECAAVRPSSLIHDDIRISSAQRVRPPLCILQEERLLCAPDKVCARKRTWQNARRLVAAARRGAQDRTVDMWMPKPNSEGQLSTRRDAEHRAALSGAALSHSETCRSAPVNSSSPLDTTTAPNQR